MRTHPSKARMLTTMLRQSIVWLVAIVCALATGLGGVFLVAVMAGHDYALRHPAPMGEEDLGLGLMVSLWGGAAFLLSIPLMIWLLVVFKRAITKALRAAHKTQRSGPG